MRPIIKVRVFVVAVLAVLTAIGVPALPIEASAASAAPDLVVEGALPLGAESVSFETVELWLFSVRTPVQAAAYVDQRMILAAAAPIRLDGTYSLPVDLAQVPPAYVDPDGAVSGRLDVVGADDTYVGTLDALATATTKRGSGAPVYVDADVVEVPTPAAKRRASCGTSLCSGPYNACRQGDETPIWHDIRQYTVERTVDFQRVFTLDGTEQTVRMFNGHQVSTSVMASVPWADVTLFSAGQQAVHEGSWSEKIPVANQSNVMVRAGVEMHWHELQRGDRLDQTRRGEGADGRRRLCCRAPTAERWHGL
jgi:hypothetical protein